MVPSEPEITEINGGIFRGRGDPNRFQRKLTEVNGGPRHKAGDKKCFHHLTPNKGIFVIILAALVIYYVIIPAGV